MNTPVLEWNEKYSVGVVKLDNQHKNLFIIINQLIDAISTKSAKERLGEIIQSLLEYKKEHFETEEKYFKEFNYEGAEEHIQEHKKFNDSLVALTKKYPTPTIDFAFELVDFLEDWLVEHLLDLDQKYVECFKYHGLK